MATTPTKKKVKSGFCGNGFHEGTKPRSIRGVACKTCVAWETCGCECHASITAMFASAGLPRVAAQNPEYHTPPRTWWMPGDPDPVGFDALSSVTGPDAPLAAMNAPAAPIRPATVAASVPTTLPAAPAVTYEPTPTGRKARGQLEYEVWLICNDFARDVYEQDLCTPKFVAEQIGKVHAIEPPSTGAISAVWNRWVNLKFATQEAKPLRFTGFVQTGTWEELERMKVVAKRAAKRDRSATRRGVR